MFVASLANVNLEFMIEFFVFVRQQNGYYIVYCIFLALLIGQLKIWTGNRIKERGSDM